MVSEAWVGYDTSLALDKEGHPHIGYHDLASPWHGTIKYAWHNGAGWQIETVGDAKRINEQTPLALDLALDRSDRPCISYYDDTDGNLQYAWRLSTLLLQEQATPADGLRIGDALTYTLVLSGPGLGVQLWDRLPANALYVAGSITSTAAPAAVYSPTAHALLWQGSLPTNTAQTIRFQVSITGTEALSPAPPILNTAWLTDTYGRSVAATVIVNGHRTYLPSVLRQTP